MFYRCIPVYTNVTVVYHQEGLSIFFAYIVYYLYTIDITFFFIIEVLYVQSNVKYMKKQIVLLPYLLALSYPNFAMIASRYSSVVEVPFKSGVFTLFSLNTASTALRIFAAVSS